MGEIIKKLNDNTYNSHGGFFGNLNACKTYKLIAGYNYILLWDDEIQNISEYNKCDIKIIAFRKNGIGVIEFKDKYAA